MTVGEYLKQLRKEKSISQRELAEKSGISNAEISRIETGERQKPSPDVLRQLASALNVPYESLMDKAGYINERSAFIAENREAEDKFISIITPELIIKGWGIEPIRRGPALGDIVARKDNEEWHIDFKYFRTRDDDDKNFREELRAKDVATRLYGRLAVYNKTPITKFTIAVNDEKIFNYMIKYPPIHLSIKTSIMLVDLDEGKYTDYEF
jgi:transcriptional regulator with XRE-family HTH domain